jgi:hypothetical protein
MKKDKIGYYEGVGSTVKLFNFAVMRQLIQAKQLRMASKRDLIVIIKPTSKSTYKNLIDALDEITINDCRHYYILPPEQSEEKQ